jgi:hypothetical protein
VTAGGRVAAKVEEAVRGRAREMKRELVRPWRTGRGGAAAETGRWLGLGLALGAVVAGVTAAVWASRRR